MPVSGFVTQEPLHSSRGPQIDVLLTRDVIPTGKTEIPFEFTLEPLPGKVPNPRFVVSCPHPPPHALRRS